MADYARIACYDSTDLANGDMALITEGSLSLFYKINGYRRTGAILTRNAAGTARVGEWTTLDGYFLEQPEILLAPKKFPSYFAKFHPGTQSLSLGADIREKSEAGKYEISPTVTFNMNVSAKTESLNLQFHSVSYDTSASGGTPRDFLTWPSNAPSMTGWYPAAGALSVTFYYDLGYHIDFIYPYTMTVYLDVATSCIPTMGAASWSRRAASGNEANYGTISYSGPNSLYMWRLRRNVVFEPAAGLGGEHYLYYRDSFTVSSYTVSASSVSEPQTDTGIEVFYLAIGR